MNAQSTADLHKGAPARLSVCLPACLPAPPHNLPHPIPHPLQVNSALYSWVTPSSTGTEPTTIACSAAVARLAGLDPADCLRPEFALIFSGAPQPQLLGGGGC